ncbi:preprotein translocase subunit SecG [Geothrix sp. PMB-07]|uniref:preprotein translocase subunit SecG n=1 Tax=Geothrix sp. PMB-07 TaxID=3068640 RepID=UPI0027419B6F|nr:preprotein translocase subunit SecG [Geothrix sp. PMB-07]WLT30272.1 preprotein translocase subunit SecG [Geothrix sp. PMB-07]
MNGLAITFLILFGVLLIGTVLLQPGTKGGLGASFGGGGANSAFGAQGATPFLSKATYWLAGGFLATTLMIEVLIIRQNRSVLEKTSDKPVAAAPAPVVPTPAPATVPVPAPAKK